MLTFVPKYLQNAVFQVILLQNTVFSDFLLRLPASLFLCDPRLASLMIHNFYAGGITKFATFSGPKVYRRLWLEVEFDGGIYQAITYEMSRWTKFIRH